MISLFSDLRFVIPEIILIAAAICVLALDFVTKSRRTLGYFSILSILFTLFVLSTSASGASSIFSGMLASDPFSLALRILAVYIAAVVALVSMDYEHISSAVKAEFYSLLFMVTAAMMFLASANNFLMIYLGIECISLISYVFAAYWKGNLKSSESGLKYFLFGSACSMIMLYGISLIYGLTGSLSLTVVGETLFSGQFNLMLVFAALAMFWAGLAFKIAMAPFHLWCPDVYEGAPTPMTAFFSVGPKLLGFAVMTRFIMAVNILAYKQWSHLLGLLAILTMVVGNLTALSQNNIKRLLAYSSIAHAGYALIGLIVNTPAGRASLLIYLATYIVMNLGAFAVIIAVSAKTKSDELKSYEGLAFNSPYLAALLAIFMISLAGLPPLAGFIGKFYIFAAAIKEGYLYLAVAGAINSVIAAYYYFNVIRVMYLVHPSEKMTIKVSASLNIALILSLVLVLAIGLYPKPVIDFITTALSAF